MGLPILFFATSDGTSTGAPRAGTFRLFVEGLCSGVGCVPATYDVSSDANGDRGGLRAGLVVSDITKNAYPAGSIYAYGPAGDESMTFTASSTNRIEDTGTNQTVRINTRRNGGAVIENASSQELGASGLTASSFSADNTYDPTSGTAYDAEFEVVGNSNLLASQKWTYIASQGNGANITRDSVSVARYANRFSVDPRIYFSTDGTTVNNDVTTNFSVYNRSESVSWQFCLVGARSEKLSRAMNVGVVAANASIENGPTSRTPSSFLYSTSYTVGASDQATHDAIGSPKNFRVTNTDQTKDSDTSHSVSALYYVDAHAQLNNTTVVKDDFPTEDSTEDFSGIIAADVFSFFGHIKNVRKDTDIQTSGSALTFTIARPNATTRTTETADTGSDGWTVDTDFSLEAPAGTWVVTASTTFNGNSGTDSESIVFISPYTGKYAIQAVGWNQAYDVASTTHFVIQTLKRDASGIFQPTAPDATPTYRLRYWDGSDWQETVSTTAMTSLGATATYEASYTIPNDAAWYGRNVGIIFSAKMSGTEISNVHEIEIKRPGNVWRDGSGAPADGLGSNGDHYLNNLTGDVYQKSSGSYSVVANILGPTGATGAIGPAGSTGATGATGANGATWRDGAGIPSNALGLDGDYYLNSSNGDIYIKASGTYSVTANILGPSGAAGATGLSGVDGATWRDGAGAPSNGLGTNGDYYLNGTNGDIYFKAGGVYSIVANVMGPAGATGATGATGSAGPGSRYQIQSVGWNQTYSLGETVSFAVQTMKKMRPDIMMHLLQTKRQSFICGIGMVPCGMTSQPVP